MREANLKTYIAATKKSLVFLTCLKSSTCCVVDDLLKDNLQMSAFVNCVVECIIDM